MRALEQTQDQLQRQAFPSHARLDAAPAEPDLRTQAILELQRTMDIYLFLEDRPEGGRAPLGGDYTVKQWEKLLVDEPNERAGGKRP